MRLQKKEIFLYGHAEQEQTCDAVNADIVRVRKVKSTYIQVKQQAPAGYEMLHLDSGNKGRG